MKFSIIVPTYNRKELLADFLNSLIVQKFNSQDFEVLIIDNNSTNDVKQQINEFVKQNQNLDIIKYFNEEKQGVGYCWNKGIEQAKGELLIFMDDDATLHYDYFKTLSNDFISPIENITGGGHISPVFEHQKPAWIYKYIMPVFAEINLGEKSNFPKKKHPFGTNMLVSKDVFNKVGNFDMQLIEGKKIIPPGTLENDFFNRVRKANIPIYYFHDLVVWHFIPQEKISKQYVREQILEAARIKKEISKQKGIGYYLYMLFKELVKHLASIPLSFYYIFSSQWEKATMLFKIRWWRLRELL